MEKAAAFIERSLPPVRHQARRRTATCQPLQVTTDAALGKANHFKFSENGHATTLRFPEEFVPFNFSQTGKLAGSVVFAGYGITAPEYHYDDYAGLDVKGKIVLLLRHEPQESDAKSVFEGKTNTQHAQFAAKATNAKLHGAIGVILVNDRANHPGAADELEKFGVTAGPTNCRHPLRPGQGGARRKVVRRCRQDRSTRSRPRSTRISSPQSFAFPASIQIDANLDVERAVKTVHNVVAYIPGTTDEYVILGAHYDHLGLGGQYSLAPSLTGTVHPGADDNASGTAGVLELARCLRQAARGKRGILFLNFAGEEQGLLGSGWYADHPMLPLANAVAMINLDMIGRMRDNKLYSAAPPAASTFKATHRKAPAPVRSQGRLLRRPQRRLERPHLLHRAPGAGALLLLRPARRLSQAQRHLGQDRRARRGQAARAGRRCRRYAARRRRPPRVRASSQPPAPHGGGDSSPPVSGYGPYFGSIPDFAEGIVGVKFADVREGSPAAKAGLKAGDIMVEFDGKALQNLYDFTYALRAKKPGDQVKVKVLRDGKPLEVTATLSRRE